MKPNIFKGGVLNKGSYEILHRYGFTVLGMECLMDGGIVCKGIGDKKHGVFFGNVGIEMLLHIAHALEVFLVFELLGAFVDNKNAHYYNKRSAQKKQKI